MLRFVLALALVLPVVFVLRANDDPEPPKKGSPHIATSGDYTINALKGGRIVATNKQDKTLWINLAQRGDPNVAAHVAIEGDYVVTYREGMLATLALKTGKVYWQSETGLTKGKMTVKNGKVTIQEGKSKDVIDLQTGKVLERSR